MILVTSERLKVIGLGKANGKVKQVFTPRLGVWGKKVKKCLWVPDGDKEIGNADIGATIPYFVRRKRGNELQTFVSVFEGFEKGTSIVKNVELIDKQGLVRVETTLGVDYIMSLHNKGEVSIESDKIKLSGHFAAASVQNGGLVWKETLP